MKYPMINRQPRREVNVPQLSGGLNLRDSLTGVRDNQMTDCVNMWYKDGMLQSRPRAREIANLSICKDCYDLTNYKIKKHNVKYKDKQLISMKYGVSGEECINSMFVSKDGMEILPALKTNASGYFFVLFESKLYCYTSNREIFMLTMPHNNGEEWSSITVDDIYVPTYITNGRANKSYYSYEATMLEGINIIGNKLKYYYSTVNPGVTDDGESIMLYKFPIMKVDWISYVKVTITDLQGKMTIHEMDIDGSEDVHYYESKHNSNWENVDDGLELIVQVGKSEKGKIDGFALGFRYSDTTKGTNHQLNGWGIIPKNATSIENDLEVIVTYELVEEDKKTMDTVFSMCETEWFGGASVGINGGTRLFLGGNTNDDRKSLIVWSALNDPLYFPENNYAYIGERDTAVTGFGKQSDMLVIFKETETYYTQYVQNNNISAEDIINQAVVDYQANCVYFPLTLINSTIGCDCPDTVQLCRNRLVWINSDGKIYSLVSNNQYSERNIYEVGQMINSRILKEYNLKEATSCDWAGHYVVFVDGHMYLMDYNSSGYQNVYSYQSNEDANIRIPWYYWEIYNCNNGAVALTLGEKLVITGVDETSGLSCNQFLIDEENNSKDELVHSMFTTKLFDFSAVGYLKNIDRVGIAFGNNSGEPISVSFITDKGSESDVVTLGGAATDERDASFVTVKNLNPCMRSVRTFGVKIECEGPLVVDGLSLQYRLLGGVK